jgi:rare lipoprotein A (peptidoglycan hydrolase)
MPVKLPTATVLLVLIAVLAGAALPATSALAVVSAGGASAPSTATSSVPSSSAQVRRVALATWFGPGFYGKRTACGQKLTPGVIGVANRTLPCGTLVKVTYTSHTLTVPVLDRGPYSRIGADWDLTAGAAQALGITETVRIRARVVGHAANSPALGAPAPAAAPPALLGGGALAG